MGTFYAADLLASRIALLLMCRACTHNQPRAEQVHEEVLRLLLAVAKQLSPEQLGRYLQTTIQRSRKSRRRVAGARHRNFAIVDHRSAAPVRCRNAVGRSWSLFPGLGFWLRPLHRHSPCCVCRRFKRRKTEPLGGIPFGADGGYSSGGYSSGGFLSGYRSSGLLNGSGAGDASKMSTPFSGNNDSAISCVCHGRARAQALEAGRHISLFAGEVSTPEPSFPARTESGRLVLHTMLPLPPCDHPSAAMLFELGCSSSRGRVAPSDTVIDSWQRVCLSHHNAANC